MCLQKSAIRPYQKWRWAGDAIATWPSLCAGWTAFTLNRVQQAASLRRLAALEARIVGEERVETRAETEVIDGKKVPLRTPEEYRHIEAALRNKIERLETELREARAGKAKADRTAERERGKAEHWRQLYTAALARVSPGQTPEPMPPSED